MVVPLIPIAVAGARVAGTVVARGARVATKGAQATGRGIAKSAQVTGRGVAKGAQNARGIQNARLSARTPITDATRSNASQALKRNDIINTDFIQRKSLSARVRNRLFNREKQQPLRRKLLNRLSGKDPNERPAHLEDRLMDRLLRTKGEKLRDQVRTGIKYGPLYISTFISALVALFGVIALSLIAFGHSNVLFGLFSLDSLVPASASGTFFYYLAVLIHVVGFIAMGLWMWLVDHKNPFATNLGFMATATCFALGVVIGTQLCFPLLIWVLITEFTSISSKEESF